MASKNKAKKLKGEGKVKKGAMNKDEAEEHIGTIRKLQEKDPEFYEFLKKHDNELLEFDEEELDDNVQTDAEEEEETDVDNVEYSDGDGEAAKEELPSRKVITSAMVDSWCSAIHGGGAKLGAVRSLLRAFRTACHYGDDSDDDPKAKFSTMSSSAFDKIMVFVLNEMDGILRELLRLPTSGGKKEMIMDLMITRPWKNYNHLVKSYLGNALHVLNQMTDNVMITFMLRRLKISSIFLAAFPPLLRKYIKVALHYWGTETGAVPVVSFLFLRDCCIRLGSDCLDDCIRGMYKAFVLNCNQIKPAKLQHIQFLSNCFTVLLGVDTSYAYQHAFVYIRQLAMILKEELSCSTKDKKTKKGKDEPSNSRKEKRNAEPSSSKKKEIFRKVHQWKYILCLELWTQVVCEYSSEADLGALAYPLSQIITGVARLVPSACYFPLRLRCVRMLNRISASTGTFIPVSLLLVDMLEIKELRKPPAGGVGKALYFSSILQVSKPTLKTRAFQEACVFHVVEELAEHLAQWSSSIAFLELSFVPIVRLRNFCKSTKVERFRKEMKQLIQKIEANSEFVNKKRTTIQFLPNDPAAASFLEDEKKSGTSPLLQYVAALRQRAKERNDALTESSVLIGESSSTFRKKIADDEYDDSDNEQETPHFTLPVRKDKDKKIVKKRNTEPSEKTAIDEDIIEDFVLSSDEDEQLNDILGEDYSDSEEPAPQQPGKKQKYPKQKLDEKKGKPGNRKSKKRKRAQGKS